MWKSKQVKESEAFNVDDGVWCLCVCVRRQVLCQILRQAECKCVRIVNVQHRGHFDHPMLSLHSWLLINTWWLRASITSLHSSISGQNSNCGIWPKGFKLNEAFLLLIFKIRWCLKVHYSQTVPLILVKRALLVGVSRVFRWIWICSVNYYFVVIYSTAAGRVFYTEIIVAAWHESSHCLHQIKSKTWHGVN